MAYWVLKGILSPVFFILWRIKVEGRENIPKSGPAVLAANHQSFCDSFFIPLVVPRKVTFLAKAEYFDSKKTAWFFRAAGQIPIRRGGGSESERALETARTEVLGKGHLLCLYPEGTRTLDAYVHKGRTGVTRLSRECRCAHHPGGCGRHGRGAAGEFEVHAPLQEGDDPLRPAHGDGPPGQPRRSVGGARPHPVPPLHRSPDARDRPPVRA